MKGNIKTTSIEQNVSTTETRNIPFPHYETAYKMLEEMGDYHDYNGSLVLLSIHSQQEHIRVSKQFLKNESQKEMIEQVKRDIVYVTLSQPKDEQQSRLKRSISTHKISSEEN